MGHIKRVTCCWDSVNARLTFEKSHRFSVIGGLVVESLVIYAQSYVDLTVRWIHLPNAESGLESTSKQALITRVELLTTR